MCYSKSANCTCKIQSTLVTQCQTFCQISNLCAKFPPVPLSLVFWTSRAPWPRPCLPSYTCVCCTFKKCSTHTCFLKVLYEFVSLTHIRTQTWALQLNGPINWVKRSLQKAITEQISQQWNLSQCGDTALSPQKPSIKQKRQWNKYLL